MKTTSDPKVFASRAGLRPSTSARWLALALTGFLTSCGGPAGTDHAEAPNASGGSGGVLDAMTPPEGGRGAELAGAGSGGALTGAGSGGALGGSLSTGGTDNTGGATNIGGSDNVGGSLNGGELPLWQQKQAAFLKVIGRRQVPLTPQETPQGEAGGLVVEHFSFQSDAKTRINGTSHRRPGAGPFPAVIYLHGTGGNRGADVGSQRALATAGFFVVAIDARYHGDGLGNTSYLDAIYKNYVMGDEHPFLYDTVWDVMRLIDYLEGRADVDSTRVGLFGRSKGGMETYLTTAIEPRIKVAVPWIGVQNWAWALDNDQWQSRVGSIQGAVDQAAKHDAVAKIDADYVRKFYDKAVPGMYKEFDAIAMLPAIAPRPLLAINGDTDARTPLAGLRLIETATQSAYAALGASDNFMLLVQPGTGHDVTASSQQATVDWFVKHLKP